MINKDRTKNMKAPVCPYCESSIHSLSSTPEPGGEPFFQYKYCSECKALLAIVPMPPDVYDVESTKKIVQSAGPKE
jgi:hypothetical protein